MRSSTAPTTRQWHLRQSERHHHAPRRAEQQQLARPRRRWHARRCDDGLLLLRTLFGFTGNAVTNNALGAEPRTRNDWAAIRSYLNTTCGLIALSEATPHDRVVASRPIESQTAASPGW